MGKTIYLFPVIKVPVRRQHIDLIFRSDLPLIIVVTIYEDNECITSATKSSLINSGI